MTSTAQASLLDQALPSFDVSEVHSLELEVPRRVAWDALMAVRPFEIRLFAPLMALRAVPALLTRRNWLALRPSDPLIEQFLQAGFIELARRPGQELVAGAIGRFWSLTGNRPLPIASPDEFRAFEEPGYAKAALNFALEPASAGTLIRTETRVACTDPEATKLFRRYWRMIYPGSALIRVSWLNAVRRRAKRAPARRAASA